MSGDDVSCVNYLFFTYNITITNIIKKNTLPPVSPIKLLELCLWVMT